MQPIYKIEANGVDVTKQLNSETSEITFNDEAGIVSDEITLRVEGLHKRPKRDDELKLWLGTKKTSLFYCGLFKVSRTPVSYGEENFLHITATAVDFSKNLKVKRSQTFEKCSIKQVCQIIATRHGLTLKSDFDEIFILHLEQTMESDLHFLKRISQEYNALFSIKNNTLIFVKRVKEGQKSNDLPRFYLSKTDINNIRIEPTNKTSYNSCKAVWRDIKSNSQKSLIVGDGEPIYMLRDAFESESDARAKAEAALQKANSGTKEGSIKCDGFEIYAGAILVLNGTLEDDDEYHIKRVDHIVNKSGWHITIKIEN
ncbi:phage tail protein [Malaciobacter mytili LMG 24559]|uniref:Phage tail protein n=1 Tax=Malaciobacter mytili LMG 24559 TaxID=1032238 RepID=A0AAX2AHC1_9BACT|nr:contractile injection system protein, VgrG/Pvc8 family [Malaciobacter mytili]AXH14384.1 putative phage tail protein [Malaciobacter mytili LMG 24559]RXK16040.1 phage tail protein [Malaciobacter mytili LMG 24559]